PRAFGVPERLAGDLEADPLAKDLDLATGPDRGLVRRQVAVRDRALDREAVAARGDPADDPAVDADRLVAQRHRPGTAEDEAAQAFSRAGGLRGDEGLAADEVGPLVEPD